MYGNRTSIGANLSSSSIHNNCAHIRIDSLLAMMKRPAEYSHTHTSRILCYKLQQVSQTHTKMETEKEKIYIKMERTILFDRFKQEKPNTFHSIVKWKRPLLRPLLQMGGGSIYIYIFTQINVICKLCTLLCINSRGLTLYSIYHFIVLYSISIYEHQIDSVNRVNSRKTNSNNNSIKTKHCWWDQSSSKFPKVLNLVGISETMASPKCQWIMWFMMYLSKPNKTKQKQILLIRSIHLIFIICIFNLWNRENYGILKAIQLKKYAL